MNRHPPAATDRFVFDIDGVCYLRGTPIRGVGRTLQTISDAGGEFVLVTNNSSETPEVFAERLAGADVAVEPERIVTSSMAAATLLETNGAGDGRRAISAGERVAVMGGEGVRTAIDLTGFVPVDVEEAVASSSEPLPPAIVVGIDLDLSYPRLAAAAEIVRSGARFVATNLDATYPTEVGLLPGAGALVAAVATASGVAAEPEIAGKPEEGLALAARSVIGDGDAVVVGDRLETDIEFARRWGFRAALVLSGVADVGDIASDGPLPDFVAEDLPALLENPVMIDLSTGGEPVVTGGTERLRKAVADACRRRGSRY